ncbi:MAG: hypothetical protein QOH43_1349, partial [Solirubrobacteraceae bacterium]|nr:hypothetical protein [Solirubrobacteraceae bacterium]
GALVVDGVLLVVDGALGFGGVLVVDGELVADGALVVDGALGVDGTLGVVLGVDVPPAGGDGPDVSCVAVDVTDPIGSAADAMPGLPNGAMTPRVASMAAARRSGRARNRRSRAVARGWGGHQPVGEEPSGVGANGGLADEVPREVTAGPIRDQCSLSSEPGSLTHLAANNPESSTACSKGNLPGSSASGRGRDYPASICPPWGLVGATHRASSGSQCAMAPGAWSVQVSRVAAAHAPSASRMPSTAATPIRTVGAMSRRSASSARRAPTLWQ